MRSFLRRATVAAVMSAVGWGAVAASQQIPRDPPVDAGLEEKGREIWAQQCVSCHGSQARGSDTGPNIIRSPIVNNDRSSPKPGSVLGPYLKKGHHTVSGALTDDQIVAIAHFVRQRVNDTMRGSPVFAPGDVLTGDAKAGEAFFAGAGGCAACHNASARNLAGVRSRVINTVDLQQRMLFPMNVGRGRGRGRGAAPAAPNPNAETVTITPPSGAPLSGVLVAQDSFYVTLREASGQIRVVKRVPGMKVVTANPLQAHIDLLDRLTDKNIHDLVAYLEILK